MKILMFGRHELMEVGGGDKIQIENTAKELRILGIEVDISTSLNTDITQYDIVHIFQLDWTPETYLYAKKAKKYNKPVVLSPIHHSVKEVKTFDDRYAMDFRRISKFLFAEQHQRDTFKNIYRSFFYPKKIFPTLVSLVIGLKNMHKQTLTMADVVLVQTTAEAADLKETYGVDFIWKKIPNGVGSHFLNVTNFENTLGLENYIVCVGRVEPRKNQLHIIEAVKKFREKHDLDVKLIIAGSRVGERHFEYNFLFDKEVAANNWIILPGAIPYEKMPSVYHFAKVCVSASWFETTGLTLIEALFCGTNAVASGDRAKEYLGDLVSYCRPDDIASIEQAIEYEYFAKRPTIPENMRYSYTWENAARLTKEVYGELLNNKVEHLEVGKL